jgi:hypothetical protein
MILSFFTIASGDLRGSRSLVGQKRSGQKRSPGLLPTSRTRRLARKRAWLALSQGVFVVCVVPVQGAEFAFDLPDLPFKPSQLVVASLVVSLALCKP